MGRSGVNAFGGGLACAGSKGRADAGARGDAVIYPLKYWGAKIASLTPKHQNYSGNSRENSKRDLPPQHKGFMHQGKGAAPLKSKPVCCPVDTFSSRTRSCSTRSTERTELT